MPGRRRASMVLPVPGGPARSRLCRPAAASSSARRARSCPRTSARSRGAAASAWASRRRQRIRLELAAQVGDRVGEMAEHDRLDACERRLCSGFRRAEHALEAHASCAFGDREDAADAAEAAVERELADRSCRSSSSCGS